MVAVCNLKIFLANPAGSPSPTGSLKALSLLGRLARDGSWGAHQREGVCPPTSDLTCSRSTADHQLNQVSSLEPPVPEAETLPIRHHGPFLLSIHISEEKNLRIIIAHA
ncbi:hypothetical protein AVEN_55111-1 [Araneus ventricosus]|uniref:Uncharacterized protein n=1 Tax=Araneus ventricosus TaxID=182803 RepID=A0A4Y2VZI6_ARAVE|nr:hypothetical protein AVEN_55111-1 [Araneus ventricosus]